METILRTSVQLLCVTTVSGLIVAGSNCAHFKTNDTVWSEDNANVTLSFTIVNTCTGQNGQVKRLRVVKMDGNKNPQHLCIIVFDNGNCTNQQSFNCECNTETQVYSITRPVDPDDENWIFEGELKNEDKFRKTVNIPALATAKELPATGQSSSALQISTRPARWTIDEGQSNPATEITTRSMSGTSARDEKNDINYNWTSQQLLTAFAVAIASVFLLVVVLVLSCRLGKSLSDTKQRRSLIGYPLDGPGNISRQNPYVVPNIFYGGSNVSLNIVNDIYKASLEIPNADTSGHSAERRETNPPRCDAAIHVMTGAAAGGASPLEDQEEEGDYAEIDSLDGDSNEGACGGADVYVSVDEIRKRKAELQKQMNASQSN